MTCAGCIAASSIALLVLVAWAFGAHARTTLAPEGPAMNPLTALCLLLASGSLWLHQRASVNPRSTWLARELAVFVVVISSVRLFSLVSGVDLPLDLLLFHERLIASPIPVRMAGNTALALACLGTGLLAFGASARWSRWLTELVLIFGLGLSLVAVLGYLYGAHPMRGFMAFHTACALLLLFASTLFADSRLGLRALVLSDSPGGVLAHRVMPVALLVPIAFGWLRLQGQRAGLYGLEIGTGLYVVVLVITLIGFVWMTGRRLDAMDQARRCADDALRRSRERHDRLLEANLIGVMTARLSGQITEANTALLEMLGYGREDLPLDADAITPPEWRTLSDTARREIAERGVATPFEKEYLRKDGSRLRVLIGAAALPDADGEVTAFVVDLTAKKQAELEIERMRGFLDSIIENLPTMVFVKDARELRFVQFNRAGERLLGFNRDDLLGKNDYDFFPQGEADFFTSKDRMVLETRELMDIGEEPIQTKSGEIRILHTKKVPILDRDGTPRYLLGISEDITERKRAEQREAALNEGLKRRTAELEIANRELEAFSYSVSHDLRAPLRHIDGFADLLQRHSGSTLGDKARHYLENISRAAKSMGLLIDDLLAFSRMGRAQMQDGPVDLVELVAAVRQDLGEPAHAAEWHVAPLPVVRGDAAMLRLVFTNLLANALKYTGHAQQAVIEVGTRTTENELIVSVRDNGVGFDMKYTHKLFGVFQRLHSDEEFEGTGIGLANVRRVIVRHGGRVWAEGLVNDGATFYVAFPRSVADAERKEAA